MATNDSPLSVAASRGLSLALGELNGLPVISSFTNNGDGSFSISGSNFGTKSQAAPVKFERFSGGSDGQLLSAFDSDWQAYLDDGSILSSTRSHSGSVCASSSKPARDNFATSYRLYPETDVVKVSYWVYIDAVPGDDYRAEGQVATQIKHLRITSTNAAGGGGPYNGTGDFTFGGFTIQQLTGQVTRNNGVTALGSNDLSPPSSYLPFPINEWCRVDMMLKNSDPGQSNGSLRVITTDSGGTSTYAWDGIVTKGAGQSFKQDCVILGTMFANYSSTDDNPLSVFNDDVCIDDTWAEVVVGDSADFSQCTRRDVLPATAWSGTSLSVSENEAVPSGTNYLFVMNENGDLNETGYEVTL